MLGWDDPWLQAGIANGIATMGPCLYTARLQVTCVAGRLEPGAGVDVLEAPRLLRPGPDARGPEHRGRWTASPRRCSAT